MRYDYVKHEEGIGHPLPIILVHSYTLTLLLHLFDVKRRCSYMPNVPSHRRWTKGRYVHLLPQKILML